MPSPLVHRLLPLGGLVAALSLAACVAPPRQPDATAPASTAASATAAESSTARPARPAASATLPPMRVMPVEAEPVAPATQAALAYVPRGFGPLDATLLYADRLRPLAASELAAELSRLGDPGDSPTVQMQVALVLAQTRASADLQRALGLLQRVVASTAPEAQPLQPLARLLAARFLDQRRVEDDRDRQVQQLRESQKRIEQLNERIEALRAIERSFARPSGGGGHTAPSSNGGGTRPATSP
ncbi:hypothetical protein [Variovorax sp. PvP013]|uniref:hypothetical protein n=1 Tax=Variovorax sp. PvP013 TaxID=3156435 RepID=UPI003D204B6A